VPGPGDDELIIELLNDAYLAGEVPAELLPGLRAHFALQTDLLGQALERRGPDLLEGPPLVDLLRDLQEVTSATVLVPDGGDLVLYDAATGGELGRDPVATRGGKSFGEFVRQPTVAAELLGEVFLILLGLVASVPDGAKATVKQAAQRMAQNSRVREIVGRLIALVRAGLDEAGRAELRTVLRELAQAVKADLKALVRALFAGLGVVDVLLLLGQVLLLLTPVGWVKKAATVSVGFVLLGVKLADKFETYLRAA
jgi:hypothetical protein